MQMTLSIHGYNGTALKILVILTGKLFLWTACGSDIWHREKCIICIPELISDCVRSV